MPAKIDMVSFDAGGIVELVTDCCTTIQNVKKFDFDDPTSLDEESYYVQYDGSPQRYKPFKRYSIYIFHSDQFDNLLGNLTSMRNSYFRSVRVALALFLVKMRLGMSNRVLSSLFRLKSKRIVSRIVHQVAEALLKDFVPCHLGFQHIDRETVLHHHQTSIASQLTGD
jgi:hypothetical protein